MAERLRSCLGACAVVLFGLASCSSPKRNFPGGMGGSDFAGGAPAGGAHNDSGAAGQSRGGAPIQGDAGAAGESQAGAPTQDDGGAAGQSDGGAAGQGESGAPPDACIGKPCATPPKSACESTTKFRAYDVQGSCSAGVCSYASQQINCTCQMGACTTDPCLGVSCASPPGQKCKDDSTLTKYASMGTCSAGSCSYQASDSHCDFGCANGACNPDPCLGVTCNTQKPAICKDTTTKTSFAATGTCSAGVCNYQSMDAPCTGTNIGCSGAGMCAVCKADSSCGASCAACTSAAPHCKDLGTTSKCVQCLVDTDCGLGYCDPLGNGCRASPNGCNTFAQKSLVIKSVSASGVLPAASHGTFVAGTYVLTGIQYYGMTAAPSEGQTITVAVNGGLTTLNSYENLLDIAYRWTATYDTFSTPPVFTYTCVTPDNSLVGSTEPVDYTVVDGTTFWLFYPDGTGYGAKYIYTKQ